MCQKQGRLKVVDWFAHTSLRPFADWNYFQSTRWIIDEADRVAVRSSSDKLINTNFPPRQCATTTQKHEPYLEPLSSASANTRYECFIVHINARNASTLFSRQLLRCAAINYKSRHLYLFKKPAYTCFWAIWNRNCNCRDRIKSRISLKPARFHLKNDHYLRVIRFADFSCVSLN